MIVETVFRELELLLSDIAFSGLHNIQPVTLRQLDDMKMKLRELCMEEGVVRMDRLIESFYGYQAGKVAAEEVANQLCALEIYEKQVFSAISQ